MIAVLQRVASARVLVQEQEVAAIGAGLLALVAAVEGDGDGDVEYMGRKIVHLRIFADEAGRMNRSVIETGGELLLVSQFTLAGETRKGRRPSFTKAMLPSPAAALLLQLAERMREAGATVRTGQFGAHMRVELVNDGPVTLIMDSQEAAAPDGRDAGGEEA